MAERLGDEEREQIIELLEKDLTRNTIAKRVGRSPDTVSRIAAEVGHVFGQTNRKNADARRAYCAEARAEVQAGLWAQAKKLLRQLGEPHTAFNFGGKDNEYREHEFPEPDVRAKQSILTSIAICVDKAEAIEKNSQTDDSGKGAMLALLDALGVERQPAPTPPPQEDP